MQSPGRSLRGKAPAPQRGVILLMLVGVLLLAAISYFLAWQSPAQLQRERQRHTQRVMQAARQALIGFALSRQDVSTPSTQKGRFGYLPCPANTNGDGWQMGSCGADKQNSIGWLPWRSLGMTPPKDANGDCLLYAVSSTYKYSAGSQMVNEDTPGMLQVVDENGAVLEGASASTRPVAIIFSPGPVLGAQHRVDNPATTCANDISNFDAWLDAVQVAPGDTVNNAVLKLMGDGVDRFVQVVGADKATLGNDRLLTLTRDDIWRRVMARPDFDEANTGDSNRMRRLTEALARCLAMYANDNGNKRLPLPAAVDLNGNDYRNNDNYTDGVAGGSYFGRYPFRTANADAIIPGTVAEPRLFEKVFNAGQACNALVLTSPGGGDLANLSQNPAPLAGVNHSRERELWNNWKDHIFYALSQDYGPNNDPVAKGGCGNCITVGGVKYAAVVIYSGRALAGQVRQAPIADIDFGVVADSKQNPANYIEVANASGDGRGDFTPQGNDLLFCLTDTTPVDVVACP